MQLTATPEARTFARIAEVWLPEGETLVHGGGAYGNASEFAEISGKTSFAKGEGLPGKAWAEARPVVLKEFDGSYFQRTEAALEAGLTCAVAVPVFAGKTLKAVLVILCGDDAAHHGAIEVWEDQGNKLHLSDGYYGTAQKFEEISQDVSFSYGQGLPGGVWAANTPILMRDLSRIGAFLRAEAAGEIGLKHGLGVPVPVPGDKTFVLTLLSSAGTPIARRFEIWDARPEVVGATKKALRIDGFCEIEGPLWPKENPPVDAETVGAWQGPVGQVVGSGLPQVHTGATGLPAGYTLMVALPVYQHGELAHVVAWYL
ncbi:GAF domain-containing protein [Donghicola sp. C2-DW-16]|uniref:GAF domain-containing protein n=1 Tax=Donghicola mangrovi TaxID=2729614 RepID=A0ABX2PDM4_9RHOB|nr:GAF domain-containing protein [Donghicola mangrovi]NVO27290.1 GAF domain-containing protein [Donghicola mangrovi]